MAIVASTPTEKQQAAMKFMAFTTGTDTVFWSQNTGYMPVRNAALQSAEMKTFFESHPNFKTTVDQLPKTRPQDSARELVPNGDEIIGKGLERITANGEPAETPVVVAAAAPSCQFLTPTGAPSAIKHVLHIQFDNVHFRRDNPSVPSDLEQMPHLLNFIEANGTLLANEHTPLISHTANDLLTGLTGVYGDQHGIPISNSFEYYNNSSLGAYNTSAFTYWTDKVAPDPANAARTLPFQMIDSAGKNLQAPWV